MIARQLHDKQACREPITIKNFVIDTIYVVSVQSVCDHPLQYSL